MKNKGKNVKVVLILLLVVIVVAPAAWVITMRTEGVEPLLTVKPETLAVGAARTITVTAADPDSGLRRIWVGLYQNGREAVLFEEDYPAVSWIRGGDRYEAFVEIPIEPGKIGIADGAATLRVMVRDHSWRGWWHGNRTYREIDVLVDTRPPEIEVLTSVHNVTQGGAGMALYRVSESCPESGVVVGENFFPGHFGHFKDSRIAMVFFALNYDQGKGTPIFARAVDRAGNIGKRGFPHHIRQKTFKRDTIRISDGFLARKMPEFDAQIEKAAGDGLLDRFLEVNRALRSANYAQVRKIAKTTEARLFWRGRFLRLPNAANRAGFADHRSYFYGGKPIDSQVHLGIDLASVARSPVPAANRGKVAFTGNIGIYGKTVLLDHGFGLFSMYSHLSVIDTEVGQLVEKGDHIGHTGATGMAGGDHLHYAILVHNTFVNPIEWWDAAWIRNNISSKIEAYETAGE